MTFFEEYQEQVHNGRMTGSGVDPLAHCALGLAAEAGEVADLVKKSQYATPKPIVRDELLQELGDVQWYLTAIADMHGLTLEDVLTRNIEKLELRHPGRYNLARLLRSRGGAA